MIDVVDDPLTAMTSAISSMELYRPLRSRTSIRLLKLSQRDLITGAALEMSEYCLGENTNPSFFGLSYCWGSPERSQTLLIEHGSVQISENLRRGLSELAAISEFDGAYFWIDQICVNQENLEERSQQVTLMKKVYQTASQTVIWLSSPLDFSRTPTSHAGGWDLARLLHTLGHTRPGWTKKIAFLKTSYPLQQTVPTSSFTSLGLPASNDRAWEELKSILSNPWFSRIWVLQEASLSRIPAAVVYAGSIHPLEHILWAGAWLWQAEGPRIDLGFPADALSNVHAMFIIAFSGIPWRIEPLLMGTDKLEASDLRDKVIGLLGLVSPESMPRSWVPDYRHTIAEVYRDATRAIIEETKQLLIFEGINYKCGLQYDIPEGLPSWVPRIHDVWPPIAATRLGKDEAGSAAQLWLEGFRACKGKPAEVLQQNDQNILPLRGVELDKVGWTSPILKPNDAEEFRLLRWLEEAMLHCRTNDQEASEAFVRKFFTTIARAKYFTEGVALCDLYDYISQHRDNIPNRHALEQLLPAADIESAGTGDGEKIGVMERNMRTISGFFITSRGKFGFGPRWTATGDIIAVLYGFESPLILRPRKDKYLLLGSSYVPGFMEGEAIDDLHKKEREESWFSLA